MKNRAVYFETGAGHSAVMKKDDFINSLIPRKVRVTLESSPLKPSNTLDLETTWLTSHFWNKQFDSQEHAIPRSAKLSPEYTQRQRNLSRERHLQVVSRSLLLHSWHRTKWPTQAWSNEACDTRIDKSRSSGRLLRHWD